VLGVPHAPNAKTVRRTIPPDRKKVNNMSMSADVQNTILSFCIANNIAQDKAIALLRDIVDDMNGDGNSYDFSFVANIYASEQASRPTRRALDGANESDQNTFRANISDFLQGKGQIPPRQ